jgi:hypothetical protein
LIFVLNRKTFRPTSISETKGRFLYRCGRKEGSVHADEPAAPLFQKAAGQPLL